MEVEDGRRIDAADQTTMKRFQSIDSKDGQTSKVAKDPSDSPRFIVSPLLSIL
jgi:hypothetical protein